MDCQEGFLHTSKHKGPFVCIINEFFGFTNNHCNNMKPIIPGFEKVFRTRSRSDLREVNGRNILKACTAT